MKAWYKSRNYRKKQMNIRGPGVRKRPVFSFMGFSLLSEMEFFAVPKNGISLNI